MVRTWESHEEKHLVFGKVLVFALKQDVERVVENKDDVFAVLSFVKVQFF